MVAINSLQPQQMPHSIALPSINSQLSLNLAQAAQTQDNKLRPVAINPNLLFSYREFKSGSDQGFNVDGAP